MKTTQLGQAAEKAVAHLLEQDGYQILDRNWKTPVCEIDVVAKRADIIYFVEVKYRSGLAQGNGFEYVANQKLKKMVFAAQIWCQHHRWNSDHRLMAASVSGPDCELIEIIEL